MNILISFLIWVFLWLPVALMGLIVVPIALLFERNNHFPKLFWLWDNWNDGVHGTSVQPYAGFWKGYIWIALRNPCSNWGKLGLGIKRRGMVFTTGDETIRNNTHAGSYTAVCGWAWEYMWCLGYGSHFARIRIGWKLTGGGMDNASFVFSVSPFKTFKGQ